MYKILIIISAVMAFLGISIGFLGFPIILKHKIKKEINLKPDSDTRRMWEKSPIPVDFSVYVFNLTNPLETQNGGKPILNEIGPFVFEEWKDKFDLHDFEDEDAVEFKMRNTYKFRADLGLSGKEVITMPHPLVQTFAIAIKRSKPEIISLIAAGLKVIFGPNNAFISAPFMDLFFNGFVVDCSHEHFAAQAICSNFETGGVRGATSINATHYKFSLMGAGNHSSIGELKVMRGIKKSADVGKVIEFNGKKQLDTWNGEECNRLQGTDSTIFPPLMSAKAGLWAFSPDLCRSVKSTYKTKLKYAGLPVVRYEMDFGDVKQEPDKHCFCQDYPTNCPAKGTMDLSVCSASPMIASQPHFLNADQQLLNDVEGLQPDNSKHNTYIDMEVLSGTPLSLAKRLQFSLDVEPVAQIGSMKNLKRVVMPLFWVEESLNLNEAFTKVLKKKIFNVIKTMSIFEWTTTVFGLLGCTIGLAMLFMKQNSGARVVTLKPNENSDQKEQQTMNGS